MANLPPVPPYRGDIVQLNGGLDFASPKSLVEPGTLQDCLNYEIIDRIGYKRIDGFTKYDGRIVADITSYYRMYDADYAGTLSTDYPVGSPLVVHSEPTKVFGVVVALDNVGKYIYYALTNLEYAPILGDTIDVIGGSGQFLADDDPEVASSFFTGDADEFVDQLNTYNSTLRGTVGALINPALGLHWFRDRLYAFCDEQVMGFTSGGTAEVFPGDTISGANGFAGTIIDIDLNSGTWAGGDAAGDMLVYVTAGSLPTSGDIDITRPQATVTNGFTAAAATAASWKAGMWVALDEQQAEDDSGTVGWNRVTTGWKVNFENGNFSTGELPKLDRTAEEITYDYVEDDVTKAFTNYAYGVALTDDPATTAGSFCVIEPEAGGDTNTISYLSSESDDNFLRIKGSMNGNGSSTTSAYSRRLVLTNLADIGTAVPAGATIKGVAINLYYDLDVTTYNSGDPYVDLTVDFQLCKYSGSTIETVGGAKTLFISGAVDVDSNESTATIGGSTDLWGETVLDPETVRDSSFGLTVRAYAEVQDIGGLSANKFVDLQIDRMDVTVYYESPFVTYYFYNGSDDVKADVIGYFLEDGNFAAGTAEGVLQLANVLPHDTADRRSITVGDEIYTLEAGQGSKIGDVTSNMSINAPESHSLIKAANSKYQMVTANFYANDTWDAFYGVTGAGRAFFYDGTYYTTIYTQSDATKDKPRHIAFHHLHLALGFRSGSVLLSRAGYPDDFSTAGAAFEAGIGDRVTGLLPLSGTHLGVFCENSIWSLVGTSVDNFSTTVLAPSTGAIEYTVVDVGVPVYCDYRGISHLQQSEKYGDFLGTRLSAPITSWILPRLRKGSRKTTGRDIVCAIPVRAKNQYRLFFRDGAILTMTLNGGEMNPSFTFQKYYLGQSTFDDTDKYMVPLAYSAQADNEGKDRIHVSHYSDLSEAAASKYVYELDRGWSFDGNFIPAEFVTNWYYKGDPASSIRLMRARLEGLSYGYSNLNIYTAKDFDLTYHAKEVGLDLPRSPDTSLQEDWKAYTNINELAAFGRTFAIKIKNDPESITDPEPSHICQVLLVYFTTEGPSDK